MDDEVYLEAVLDAYEADDTDIGGGVPPHAVADRLDIHVDTASHRCRRLADEGHIEIVMGIDPESRHPRQSYLPANQSQRL